MNALNDHVSRNILLITTDQQRYDSLGCNGGTVASTPAIDGLAAAGLNYQRAHCQNVVCMPARASILTGQYPRTNGVWNNGVPLPADAPSIAQYLSEHGGYRTALIGKGHFEPVVDIHGVFPENLMALAGSTGPYRGFDHVELVFHNPQLRRWHYDLWLQEHGPQWIEQFYPAVYLTGQKPSVGGGDTGAVQVWDNPIPRELYHTDWVVERTIARLDELPGDAPWFVWMSFPDPHHPWDLPSRERERVRWRDLDLPAAYPGSPQRAAEILADRPPHWLSYFNGALPNPEGGSPRGWSAAGMDPDQLREIDAAIHAKNELIDEGVDRVLSTVRNRGWDDRTDVFFTTDHGELQGDLGLLFKGPFHVDGLMRVPMIWRPAPLAGVEPATVTAPVGQIDLAATFCEIAGVPIDPAIQGRPLPTGEADGKGFVLTEWDSQLPEVDLHLRTAYHDGWVATTYEASSTCQGDEGELYDLTEDPHQWVNRWSDPAAQARRTELVDLIRGEFPAPRQPRLELVGPA